MARMYSRNTLFAFLMVAVCLGLYILPDDFSVTKDGWQRIQAEVIAVDNSQLQQRGVVKVGSQLVRLNLLEGSLAGQQIELPNQLLGQLEFDKIFQAGDCVLVVSQIENGQVVAANLIDYYRLQMELLLAALLVLLLIGYAGWTGVRSVLSFVFTVLVFWKLLWPLFLKGWDPVLVSLAVLSFLTGGILFLVGGLNAKSTVAFAGTMGSAILVCVLSLVFGKLLRVHGAVVPFSETLLHLGFAQLDLTRLFLAGIFLSASGAMMDVAMDIAAAVEELAAHDPGLTRSRALAAGMNVGKVVVGTMTTTLLLAYSSSFTALMMVFIAQGTPMINLLNLTYVAAEILHTLVGSFGVVAVAPLTAFLASRLLVGRERSGAVKAEEEPR